MLILSFVVCQNMHSNIATILFPLSRAINIEWVGYIALVCIVGYLSNNFSIILVFLRFLCEVASLPCIVTISYRINNNSKNLRTKHSRFVTKNTEVTTKMSVFCMFFFAKKSSGLFTHLLGDYQHLCIFVKILQ